MSSICRRCLSFLGLLDRFGAEVAVVEVYSLGSVLRYGAFRLERGIEAIESPHDVRRPADAAFDEDELQGRERLEGALGDAD